MRVLRLALSAGSGALFGALTPVLALLLLAPATYGLFSIVYLIFAFGISLQYSVVSEAWARSLKSSQRAAQWGAYSTALLALSATTMMGAFAAGWLLQLGVDSVVLAGAVFFTLYRNGARYFCLASAESRRVFASDLIGIAAFSAILVIASDLPALTRISLCWLAAGLSSSLMLRLPRAQRRSGLVSWIRAHRSAIKPLLLDSLLMDAGAIGTPFLLAGFLGTTRFGVYRAVANVAMPVRLLLDPLRPALGRMEPQRVFRRGPTIVVGLTTALLVVASYTALTVIVPLLGSQLGTLSSLVPYAPASSLFVAGSFLGTLYYIMCRTNALQRHIVIGRAFQTGLVIVLPLAGFAIDGLNGAIWGFAISSAVSSVSWIRVAHLSARRG